MWTGSRGAVENRGPPGDHGRSLLGGEGEDCRPLEGHRHWPGGGHVEDEVGRHPVRSHGQVGWGAPRQDDRGSSLPAGLRAPVEGRAATRHQSEEAPGRRKRGLDGERGRSGRGARRRGGRASPIERKGQGARPRGRRGAEGSGGREGRRLVKQFRRKEKEKEKEEEGEKEEGGGGEAKGLRHQGPDGGFWRDRFGPPAKCEEEDKEKGKALGQEKEPEEQQQYQLDIPDEQCEWGDGGGLRPFVWRRGEDEDAGQEVSGRFNPEHLGTDPNGGGVPDGAAMGVEQRITPADLFPILAADAEPQDVGTDVQGGTNVVLPSRLAIAGKDRGNLRHHHPASQGPGTGGGGIPLPGSSAPGVGSHRLLPDDQPYGVFGGLQTSEGGSQGESSGSQTLGERIRLGKARRGAKGQGEREGRKEQRKRKGRQRRAFKGGKRQGEALRLRRCGELVGSEGEKGTTAGMSAKPEFRPACGLALVPEPFFEPGLMGPTGPGSSDDFFSPEGKTFYDMANSLFSMFAQLENSCNLPRIKVQNSGGVFPLPECPQALQGVLGHATEAQLLVLRCVCRALNSYYGSPAAERPLVSAAAGMAVKSLAANIEDSGLAMEKFEGLRWEDYLNVKTVDYRGEEIRLARKFSWGNIEPALPEGIGSIPLVEVCEQGILHFVENFESYLLPEDARVYTKPPKVYVDDSSWEQVCSGLLRKGVCRVIAQSDVFQLDGRPLLNGLFGVSKQEFSGSFEVFRLIMNLVPLNKLCRNLGADVCTLPSVTGLGAILLENHEVLVMSSEDIKCFFYIFSVPASWHRFLAFGRQVPASLLPPGTREPHYLSSLVLPMGFAGSVTIAQHIHRRLARLTLHGITPSHGPQCEMRRDKPNSVSPWLYRVYLDNYDSLERMDGRLAALIRGEPSAEALAMREGYQHWGLPRHPKKSVQQAVTAEIQGAMVDGVTGKVKPKLSKVLKYIELALLVINEGRASQRQMQIICGGFVYCAMFRRALLGMLNAVWVFITSFENDPPVVKRNIPQLVQLEIIRFICAIPLAQMNLRTSFRGDVTVSDASEWGGGFCQSNGLTPMGIHAAHCHVRGDLPELGDHVQVLTVGLFDGIGALRVGADALKLPMGGHISSEVSSEGARVLESNFPDSEQVGNVENITEEEVQRWAVKYGNVGVVLVGGGPPCQGVSGLNSDRKGALKDARSSLFYHVRRVHGLVVRNFPWAQVHYLMESVFSMDEHDRAIMSEHMDCIPYMVDASDIAVCRRPRLYWISWEIQQSPEVQLVTKGNGGWTQYIEVRLHGTVEVSAYVLKGWTLGESEKLPTFTTARPRLTPGNKPAGLWQCAEHERARWEADLHRFPPYVYRDKHCLTNGRGEFRLPSIQEKEVAMGFPVNYTAACMPKGKQPGAEYLDTRHSLVGNSWHVPVIGWLLKELFHPLGMTRVQTLEDVLVATAPGKEDSLQGFLRRPPLQDAKHKLQEVPERVLTRKLVNFVSIKGEDLLLQAESENSVKFHRLRTSVPSKLWKWKTICGWPWKQMGYHINVLEAQAVLTCLKWRLGRKRQQRCRFLHLTDSLVTLHALSRGRSSSRKLRPVLSKINSLLLATDTHPVWGYLGWI